MYELLVTHQQLEAASQLISACPEVTFVIEHAAKPAVRDGEITRWREQLMLIGEAYSNVFANYQAWSRKQIMPAGRDLGQASQSLNLILARFLPHLVMSE